MNQNSAILIDFARFPAQRVDQGADLQENIGVSLIDRRFGLAEVVLVDFEDRELGSLEKTKAHEQGKLHRAFSVFILDGQKMLLQQRSTTKYHSGGLWTNACCSHPAPGEPIEDAAIRRCKEELGIAVNPIELFSFIYRAQLGNLVEYEYDHVFLANYSGPVPYDKSEVESINWMKLQEVRLQVVENPQLFTPWFFTAFNQIQRFLPKGESVEAAK